MLYLFNSAAHIAYTENVLNTLSLPVGYENIYQYSVQKGHNYVHESAIKGICDTKIKGEKVLISFIDRVNNTIYPMRVGRLKCIEEKDQRIYYTVILQDYCATENVECFTALFREMFKGLILEVHDGNEKGMLSLKSKEDITTNLIINENSWITSVREIAKSNVMSSFIPIFTKVHIKTVNNDTVSLKNNKFELKTKHSYKAEISYYVKAHDINPEFYSDIELTRSPDIFENGILKRRFGTKQGFEIFSFTAGYVTNNAEVALQISDTSKTDKEVKISIKPISIAIKRGYLRYILLGICVVLFAVFTCINSIDIITTIKEANDIINNNGTLSNTEEMFFQLSNFLYECRQFYKIISSMILSFLTLLIVFLYGRKEL